MICVGYQKPISEIANGGDEAEKIALKKINQLCSKFFFYDIDGQRLCTRDGEKNGCIKCNIALK